MTFRTRVLIGIDIALFFCILLSLKNELLPASPSV